MQLSHQLLSNQLVCWAKQTVANTAYACIMPCIQPGVQIEEEIRSACCGDIILLLKNLQRCFQRKTYSTAAFLLQAKMLQKP